MQFISAHRLSPQHLRCKCEDGTYYSYKGDAPYVDECERKVRFAINTATAMDGDKLLVTNTEVPPPVTNGECLPLPEYDFGAKPLDPYQGVPVENAQQVLNYGEHLPLPQYSFGP